MAVAQLTQVRIHNFVVDAMNWTPITCPHGCDYFALWNVPGSWKDHGSANVILCSDPDDENTQKPLSNGAQEVVAATPTYRVEEGEYVARRFKAGDVLFYAKAVSGDTVLILTCLQ